MEVTFLGSGTSVGVPVIGCECEVCTSRDPRNERTRSSIHVSTEYASLLIDTPPELRLQMLREGLSTVDFVLYTHAHADHIMGLDDLRPLCKENGGNLPVYGQPKTLETLEQRFSYVFEPVPNDSWTPNLTLHPLTEPRTIREFPVRPLPVQHGEIKIYGYRMGPIAYLSDVSSIPESTMKQLRDLDLLVLDCLRHEPHPTHLHLNRALEVARQIDANRTYFTHLAHEIEYKEVTRNLPEDVGLAYDGLRLTVPKGDERDESEK